MTRSEAVDGLGISQEGSPGSRGQRAAPHTKMAVQGFKGSRAIESEEAEYKGLVRGLLLGCALPSVMLCIFLWNTGVSTNIVSKDVGAPIEVMERMKAIEGLEPKAARKVFFRGANRTVVRDPKNPFNRGKVDNSLAQQRLRAFLNKTKAKSAPMPWDIREARNEKRMSKSTPTKGKKGPPLPPHVPPHVQAALSAARGKRVFDASTQGKGFAPGQARTPTAGTKLLTMSRFQKLVDQRCAVLIGFYNSKDAEMSREFSLVWDMVVRSSALKYTGAFVDVATSGGGEIAANASVIKVEGSKVQKPVGTPSVIAYFVQGAYAEPYAKVVLRDMKEAGPVSGRAGKDSKSGVGRDALAALRIRHEAIATLTKKLSGEVERRGLALDAKGCYVKQKSMEEYDKAEKARVKEKEKKKEEKAATKDAKAKDASKKDSKDSSKDSGKDTKKGDDKDAKKDTKKDDKKDDKGKKDDKKKDDKKVTGQKDAKAKVLTGAVEP